MIGKIPTLINLISPTDGDISNSSNTPIETTQINIASLGKYGTLTFLMRTLPKVATPKMKNSKTKPTTPPVDKNATESNAGVIIPNPDTPTTWRENATKAATKGNKNNKTKVLGDTPSDTAFLIASFKISFPHQPVNFCPFITFISRSPCWLGTVKSTSFLETVSAEELAVCSPIANDLGTKNEPQSTANIASIINTFFMSRILPHFCPRSQPNAKMQNPPP